MSKYSVAHIGCSPDRGFQHVNAFVQNSDRFDQPAICDLNEERLNDVGDKLNIERRYTDAETMMTDIKPDVLCFVTMPTIRMPLIELGIKHKAKAIAFEKPMAPGLTEAQEIIQLCNEAGVKTVVSHQHKFGSHWKKVREIAESGDIGELRTVHASSKGWLLYYATHLIDYMMFLNDGSRIKWVVGHAHGTEAFDRIGHPSPDYLVATMEFENGVRGSFECGDGASQ